MEKTAPDKLQDAHTPRLPGDLLKIQLIPSRPSADLVYSLCPLSPQQGSQEGFSGLLAGLKHFLSSQNTSGQWHLTVGRRYIFQNELDIPATDHGNSPGLPLLPLLGLPKSSCIPECDALDGSSYTVGLKLTPPGVIAMGLSQGKL